MTEPILLRSGIPPGGQFDYLVPINSSGQWGTYWVHAHALVRYIHSSTATHQCLEQGQYADGLRAPLVLHPQKEYYMYDDEFTVVLGDWYHHEHSALLKHFISIANPRGAEPIPGECFHVVFFLISLVWLQIQVSFISPRMGPTLAQ